MRSNFNGVGVVVEEELRYRDYVIRLGEITVAEVEIGDEIMEDVVIPGADAEIISTLIRRPEGWVALGCGDDRSIAPESAHHLVQEGLPTDQPYLRCFGGLYGLARVSLVAAVAQHGPDV